MGSALFYHLTRSGADSLLSVLVAKSRQAGWRVELRGVSPDRMEMLDQAMWQGDGFVPHGLAGGPHDARQPVLLTVAGPDVAGQDAVASGDVAGQGAANEPDCIVALDGAGLSAAECAGAQRVCVVFDGNDPDAVARARDQWRALVAAGVSAEYWSEASGRWEKKASAGG